MLFSLGWRILWLPLGILFPLPYLLRHPTILVFACGTYAAVIVWKLASVSRLFRRMDVLTLASGCSHPMLSVSLYFCLFAHRNQAT